MQARRPARHRPEDPATVSPFSIPVKTLEGQAEMSTRSRRLSQRHRTVMFLVDGRRNLAEVQRMAVMAGAPESLIGELLELGLVVLVDSPLLAGAGDAGFAPQSAQVLQPDIPVGDSLLPPLEPLPVQSVQSEQSTGQPPADLPVLRTAVEPDDDALGPSPEPVFESDDPLGQAREMLMRAVKDEAPLTGSITLMRLRRAKSIDELQALLEEVEQRITKPNRTLLAQQLMSNVRQLLILAGSR